MIFDTTFLIDVMQKDEKALSLLHLFGEKSEYGLVSAVSIFELHSGLARSGKSLSEQKSIVAKLDALSTETKKLEAIYKQKLADLEELKKAVLKKAFSGEL